MYRIDTRSPNVISLTGRNCARFEQEKTERTELAVPRMDDAVEVFCRRLLRSAFVFVLISKPRTALFPLLPSVQKLRSFEQEKTEGTELAVPRMDDAVEVLCRRLLRSAFVFVLISKPRTALFPLLPPVQKLRSFEQEKTEGTELGVPWLDDAVEVFCRRLQDRHSYLSQFPNRVWLCCLCYFLFKILRSF